MVGPPVHEVEGDVERVDVRVVRVVYQCTTVLSLFHLHSHGHRFQISHALGYLRIVEPKQACHSGAGHGIVQRGIIDEGQCERGIFSFARIVHDGALSRFFHPFHLEVGVPSRHGPSERFRQPARVLHHTVEQFIVGTVHHLASVVHELEFLPHLVLYRAEILLMGGTHGGDDSHGGLYDMPQGPHFAWLADTGLEESHLSHFIEQPHGERHSHLRVVAAWRTCHPLEG